LDKRQVAGALEEIALLLEIAGENRFKSRAYVTAARAIESLDREIDDVVAQDELTTIPGVGKAIEGHIRTLVTTGRLPYLEELREKVPLGLRDMMRVPGLGPKRVRELYEKFGIKSLEGLEYLVESGTLKEMRGYGETMQRKIREGIEIAKRLSDRFLLSEAMRQGHAVHEDIAHHPAIIRSALAGSLRRCAETVGDIDLVVATADAPAVMKAFVGLPPVREVLVQGETKSAVRLRGGVQVDLRCVSDAQYPYLLHHSTGSKDHNVALRARAITRGLKINEYGLWRGEELVPCADETEFFRALGLAYIPPELRENCGEIEAAERGELPTLLEPSDLQGTLHNHTLYSDGRDTVRDMVLAARERGYRYIGFNDHSLTASYANGMSLDQVREQRAEIERLREEFPDMGILQGTECDILPDGSLDFPEAVLASFDFVIGSVHSRFGMEEDEMTARVVRALHNPFLDVLGHPKGRLLLSREGYRIDLRRIIEVALEQDVAIEINANPHRLDLDWRYARPFLERGGWVSINPDAHRTTGLDDVRYGVLIARKAWATRERVMNALPFEALGARFRSRREKLAS